MRGKVLIVNRYEIAYDMILDIQQEIISKRTNETEDLDRRIVKVLSAAYILQDYLAERIAVIGESPEGEDIDGITWETISEAFGRTHPRDNSWRHK